MLILALAILATTPPISSAPIPQVEAYESTLAGLQSGESSASVESAFEAAIAVRERLLKREGDSSILERLPDKDFDALTGRLSGIIVNREEVLIVQPDPAFFQLLAGRYGRPADVEFFRNYIATIPDGIWPSYIDAQTDYSGCTALGKGELVKRYAGWLEYRSKYPNAYEREVAARLADIESEVAESTCACGSWREAYRELEAFADAFPASPAFKQARKRAHELHESTSNIRFNCHSG